MGNFSIHKLLPAKNWQDSIKKMIPNYGVMDLELKGLEEVFRPDDSSRFKTTRIRKFLEPETRSCRSVIDTRRSQISHSASTITLLAASDSDDDPSTLERSPIAKLDIESKKKSNRTQRNEHQNRRHSVKSYCNSSPELSSQYESDLESEIDGIRPHPIATQKILIIQTKISELLDEISYRLGRIPRPDDDSDLRRRQKRVMEFGVRFSRNYLYDLGRQINDIQRHVRAISPNFREKITRRGILLHMQTIEQKLTSVHQLLLNALIAYAKHIPCSVLQGQPGKLKEVLQIVVDLQEICNKINMSEENFGAGDTAIYPLGNDIQARCYEILEKLNLSPKIYSPVLSQGNLSTGARSSATARKRKNQLESRKSLANRLSMYNVDPKHFQNPKSRRPATAGTYPREQRHSVTYMPCSNPQPPPTPIQSYSNPLTKKSSKKFRKARVNGLLHEDKIRTTMELVPTKSDTQVQNKSRKNSRPSTKSSRRLVDEEPEAKKITISEKDLMQLVPVISDLMFLIANQKSSSEIGDLKSLTSCSEIIKRYRQSEVDAKIPKETRELDNVKLICLNGDKHDDKLIDAACQATQDKSTLIDDKEYQPIQLIFNEASAQRLLDYRINYNEFCLSSPMYISKSRNKPWEIVAWIADKLVEDLLVDISKELRLDGVIKRLFEMEFRDS